MGFLHKLWDDTVAGPTPDAGLGRLRKYAVKPVRPPPLDIPDAPDGIPISRAITVVRSAGTPPHLTSSVGSPTPPTSPAGSSAPSSPFSPSSPGGNFKKFTRRKPKLEASPPLISNSESKASFDWVVMQNALDH